VNAGVCVRAWRRLRAGVRVGLCAWGVCVRACACGRVREGVCVAVCACMGVCACVRGGVSVRAWR
jgi:hypothetical protein